MFETDGRVKMATGDSFVPILTVSPEYGNAPCLWLATEADTGVGGCLCDGVHYDDSFPMSEGLWCNFADWAIDFDRTRFYSDDFDDSAWDWLAFNARGLQLARWLKEEVGSKYRVAYWKPNEDPNYWLETCCEILDDGSLRWEAEDGGEEVPRFCQKIVSGGQTGADRAALDFAIRHHGYAHGGWVPQGRTAEDGPIPMKYQLAELDGGYRQRTKRNVEDSDGTLVLNLAELADGSLMTLQYAERIGKPAIAVQLEDSDTETHAGEVLKWLEANAIQVVNVAGPRESKRPGVYAQALAFLKVLDAANCGNRHGERLDQP